VRQEDTDRCFRDAQTTYDKKYTDELFIIPPVKKSSTVMLSGTALITVRCVNQHIPEAKAAFCILEGAAPSETGTMKINAPEIIFMPAD